MKFLIKKYVPSVVLIFIILLIWQVVSLIELIPRYILPAPTDVLYVFIFDFKNLFENLMTTLTEALLGLFFGILLSFSVSFFMDRFSLIYRALYPLLIISQTVPTVVIAPLLILFLGYGILPKLVLVTTCCFFPLVVSFLEGFSSVDQDYINLMRTMKASDFQIYKYVKLPFSLNNFFAGLKVSVTYSFTSAVVAEWLGGSSGLGVYMTHAKKFYAFDKMFAVVFLIIIVSLLLFKCVDVGKFLYNNRKRNLKCE